MCEKWWALFQQLFECCSGGVVICQFEFDVIIWDTNCLLYNLCESCVSNMIWISPPTSCTEWTPLKMKLMHDVWICVNMWGVWIISVVFRVMWWRWCYYCVVCESWVNMWRFVNNNISAFYHLHKLQYICMFCMIYEI